MKFAVIDIGSNTTILMIVEVTGDSFKVLLDKIYFTRLGEGIDSQKVIDPKSLARLEESFISIRNFLEEFQVTESFLVATSASRQAENKTDLFDLVKKYKFQSLDIISEQKEAELTFLGALYNLPQQFKNPLVIDIGGASTELASHNQKYSLKMGSVSLTEKFLDHNPVSPSQKENLNNFILENLAKYKDLFCQNFDAIVFTAGTPVSLAFLEKNSDKDTSVHGIDFTEQRLDFWLDTLSKASVQERHNLKYLEKYRADVIVAGLMLLKQILKATKKTQFIISGTGLRYGVALRQIKKLRS